MMMFLGLRSLSQHMNEETYKQHPAKLLKPLPCSYQSLKMDDLDLIATSGPATTASPASAELRKLQAAWTIDCQPAVTAMANDRRHTKHCKESQCTRCNYVEHKDRLAKLTPLSSCLAPHLIGSVSLGKMHEVKGCWLSSAIVDGKWGAL